MRILLLLPIVIFISGCQQNSSHIVPPQRNTDFWDSVSAKTSDWSYICDPGGPDQFGENKKTPYCTITVSNFGKTLIGNSYTISHANIIYYTKGTAKVIKPLSDSPCDSSPKRIAVDGRRIDQLSDALQIKAMLSGKLYTREEQANWPYCGIAAHAAYLDGFSEIYQKMLNEYQARFSN